MIETSFAEVFDALENAKEEREARAAQLIASLKAKCRVLDERACYEHERAKKLVAAMKEVKEFAEPGPPWDDRGDPIIYDIAVDALEANRKDSE